MVWSLIPLTFLAIPETFTRSVQTVFPTYNYSAAAAGNTPGALIPNMEPHRCHVQEFWEQLSLWILIRYGAAPETALFPCTMIYFLIIYQRYHERKFLWI